MSGVFPDCLKVARITPVFKSGDSESVVNYRPISILSVIDKIFEAAIYSRLVKFLKACDFFHCTRVHVWSLQRIFIKQIDCSKYVSVIFFDSSKAFDLVVHEYLFEKLELAGVRGIPLDLLRS